jgi:hypothetical protein
MIPCLEPPKIQKLIEQQRKSIEEEVLISEERERLGFPDRQPPRFVNQVPNLVLKPGVEAFIDVEVESSQPARYMGICQFFSVKSNMH